MFFRVFLVKNLTISIFLVKFHSKINISIYLTLLLFKLWQKRFSPNVTKLRQYHLIKVRKVREFRDVSEFRDVPEFRVPPNLTWEYGKENSKTQKNVVDMILYFFGWDLFNT